MIFNDEYYAPPDLSTFWTLQPEESKRRWRETQEEVAAEAKGVSERCNTELSS